MNAVRIRIAADQRGFTLIEVLVTIIISAVLAVILAQVIANQTDRSYRPIQVINENLALRAVMENIAADCSQGDDVQILRSRVENGDYWNSESFSFMGGITIDIAYNACIRFDPTTGDEDAGFSDLACTSSEILKVTLEARGTSHRLTSLFAPRLR